MWDWIKECMGLSSTSPPSILRKSLLLLFIEKCSKQDLRSMYEQLNTSVCGVVKTAAATFCFENQHHRHHTHKSPKRRGDVLVVNFSSLSLEGTKSQPRCVCTDAEVRAANTYGPLVLPLKHHDMSLVFPACLALTNSRNPPPQTSTNKHSCLFLHWLTHVSKSQKFTICKAAPCRHVPESLKTYCLLPSLFACDALLFAFLSEVVIMQYVWVWKVPRVRPGLSASMDKQQMVTLMPQKTCSAHILLLYSVLHFQRQSVWDTDLKAGNKREGWMITTERKAWLKKTGRIFLYSCVCGVYFTVVIKPVTHKNVKKKTKVIRLQ